MRKWKLKRVLLPPPEVSPLNEPNQVGETAVRLAGLWGTFAEEAMRGEVKARTRG